MKREVLKRRHMSKFIRNWPKLLIRLLILSFLPFTLVYPLYTPYTLKETLTAWFESLIAKIED